MEYSQQNFTERSNSPTEAPSPRMASVPEGIVRSSNEKKRQHRTLTQLQVYRDLSMLKYHVVLTMLNAPKKTMKFFDGLLVTVGEAKKCVGLADAARDPATRTVYQDMARVLATDALDDFSILRQLDIISKDNLNRTKALTKGIVAQLTAWRDYTKKQGEGLS